MAATIKFARRGMTLIELLVVISILLILVTAATTMMNVVNAGAELREAARQLNAMIAGCIVRAAETGRPFGIWIERADGAATVGREIYFAASPPHYGGSDLNSRATFASVGDTTVTLSGVDQMAVAGFVQAGDFIRFNYSGPWYEITSATFASPSGTVVFALGGKPAPVFASGNPGVPFQIRRGPRKSLANPLQMPGDTVVDLAQSGFGNSGVEFALGTGPVRIMFTPSGSIDRVYYDNPAGTPVAQQVVQTLHLLVGRQTPETTNLADLNTRWVSINHQTGTVITSENAGGTVDVARAFAISGKGMGGS